MNILLLSRYGPLGASSRYRSGQFIPYLRSRGHSIAVAPLLSDLYLQRLYAGRTLPVRDVFSSYTRRLGLLSRRRHFDLVWLEYEAFPWIPAWMESLLMKGRPPYVLDLDDAVFHRYDQHSSRVVRRVLGRKIDRVMQRSALVIAGNDYLAARARGAGAKKVEILPTVVDVEKYPVAPSPKNDVFTIGWIGTPKTARYLGGVYDALKIVCQNGQARLVAIGASRLELDGIPSEVKPWTEETEVREMQKFDVGIMPLVDTPWERGKCGHKLIQYMGCSRAVVASPVGVNSTIVQDGKTGFLASSTGEWVAALEKLRGNKNLRESMGERGRRNVEQYYSLSATAPKLAALLEDAAGGHR